MNTANAPEILVHLPEPISWWPVAYGWWIVLFLLLMGVVFTIQWLIPRIKRRQLKNAALQQLAYFSQAYQQHQDARQFLQDLSRLLRQVAITYYGREKIAGLTGTNWLNFLNAQQSRVNFTLDSIDNIAQLPYQSHPKIQDLHRLEKAVKDWIVATSRELPC